MMNFYPCPVEPHRRGSRITSCFTRGSNAPPDCISPEPCPIIQFDLSREIRSRSIDINVTTMKPPRRRSRRSYFTGKRRRRRPSKSERNNFVIDRNPSPNIDELSEVATSSENSADRFLVDHDSVHVNKHSFKGSESTFTAIQMTRRNGKRSCSESGYEEPIVSSKKRMIICQQMEHNNRSITADELSESQSNQQTDTFKITIKQEPSSSILSPPSFASPLTPSDTDSSSSPKEDSLPPFHGTWIEPSSIKHSDSYSAGSASNSSSSTRCSLRLPLTPPYPPYESAPPFIPSFKSEFDNQLSVRVYKHESSFNENHQHQDRYFSKSLLISDNRTGIESEYIPRNWLDVSEVLIRPELIVRAIRPDGAARDYHSTKTLFNSLYDRFGKYQNEIIIVNGINCLKILTDNQISRFKVKSELEKIFALTNNLDVKLFVGLPDLKRPVIQFEFNRRLNPFWLNSIKIENQWPHHSLVSFRSSTPIGDGQYLTSIAIDSTIRHLIEQNDGTILIDRHKVNVVDYLGLDFCYNCLTYNRCTKMTCNNRKRCPYCSNYHDNECYYKNQPSKWFCFRCRVRGHSIISKKCPTLLIKLRSRLGKVDHNYKYVFLEEYDIKGNPKSGLARLF